MLLHKLTVGYVKQVFDTNRQRFINQEFVPSGEIYYEDETGEPITDETQTGVNETPLPTDMKQPQEFNAEEKLKSLEELLPNLYGSMVEEVAQEIKDCLNTNC